MTNRLISLLLLVGAYSAVSASSLPVDKDEEGRVVGGHEARAHSRPYMVSLQLRFLWIRMHFCGGSLLSESWILTAGHCIKESWLINWLSIDAVAGAHNVDYFDSKVQIIPISERIAHPSYKGGIGAHDIAVLKTRTPFTFTKELQPIQLPTKNLKFRISDRLILSGWGALSTTFLIPDIPSRLQEVNVKYMSYQDCYRAIENIKEYGEANPLSKKSNMCTGPISGGIAACNGDSGGPLVYYMPKKAVGSTVKVSTTPKSKTTKMPKSTTAKTPKSTTAKTPKSTTAIIPKNTTTESDDYDVIIDLNFIDDIVDMFDGKSNDDQERRIENNAVVLGVVSWGVSPCGEEGAPTVYTKVAPYLDFINKHINS